MTLAAPILRPKLVMPSQEAAVLRAAYDAAEVVLEYGAGGSTVMAADMPGKTVWSVESDGAYLQDLQAWFAANPSKAELHLHHADIGPTAKWGNPASEAKWRRWHHYPLDVWDAPEFRQPDVVLIDGRFRAACYLAVLFRSNKPATVYWDDYVTREKYHVVERFGAPTEVIGRMARFEVEPRSVDGADLAWIMDVFGQKQ